FYASAMDSAKAEADGTKPLEDEFKRIAAIQTVADLQDEIARAQGMGARVPFGLFAGQDAKHSTDVVVNISQAGLSLPDRDYYTKQDDAAKKLRDQYVAHVTKMLTLLGEPAEKAGADAKKILALETALAQASRTRVELRDPQKNYNKMTPAELQTLTPAWNWGDYFKEIGLTAPGDIDVHQPDFFKSINTAFTSTSIDDWKTYLRWHLINGAASALSSDFVNE